ncbi:MAG: hypothetical protein E7046_08920 [Lentisphaerae bacterium]|nr:hypothetical protein [Lentisphaerota bacterium]
MKKKVIVFALIMFSTVVMALKKDPNYLRARRQGAETHVNVRIVDELGESVSNANIKVFMGMNFRPKGYWIKGITDKNGVFAVKGKSCGDELEIFVEKQGYYNSRQKLCFAKMGSEHKVSDGKWLPYGATEILQLRRIHNPIVLHSFGFGAGKDVPSTNTWIGVDMARGDFVKPHGKGDRADFEIMTEWDGRPPVDCDYCAVNIRFTEPLSGGYYASKVQESEYPYVYQANGGNVYNVRQFKVVGRDRIHQDKQSRYGNDSVLVTRTRCLLNETGDLVVANYGLIRILSVDAGWNGKPTMRLACIFNPTPNDTNLEPKL